MMLWKASCVVSVLKPRGHDKHQTDERNLDRGRARAAIIHIPG